MIALPPDMAGRQQRLTFSGTVADLAEAASTLHHFLDVVELDPASLYRIELAFDEIAGNIVRHGHTVADIEVVVALETTEVILTFEDDGLPFDPSTHKPRPLDTDLDHAEVGGLGIRLVRAVGARLDYTRTPDCRNRLTVAIPIS
ncbi:MAG TPA: ATP-binding protein [Vicinamibacterales bacterium]|nr:ATP-binding protein [Vicinamibacterales bacterium]